MKISDLEDCAIEEQSVEEQQSPTIGALWLNRNQVYPEQRKKDDDVFGGQ